ncbi:MAG: hypothetical protein IT307_05115 [Chloroflexi bacterium]|nr:hypothetical protein [Chloroflexota bacterium]
MPTAESGLSAERVLDALKRCGITHVVWLPDSEANFMYEALAADKTLSLVQVCREAETVAVAVGLLAGGKQPICLLQNTGFMESGDSLRGLVIDVGLPLLMMIGYRGWRGDQPMTDSAAIYLEPLLRTWGVSYHLLESDGDVGVVQQAFQEAQERRAPVAVLIGREWKR